MVRKPAVAGQFYPGTESSLKDKIEECFTHELGPGSIPSDEGESRELEGLVCPHAGYAYSGPVAAHSYKALVEDGIPETIIFLGPSHQGIGTGIAVAEEDYETPLGLVEIDQELVNDLTDEIIQVDDVAHSREHSIEVQMPFLQYFSDSFKAVPICFNKQDFKTAKKVGERLKEVTEDRDVVIIASTDFSHYVLKENAKKKDKMAIEKILDNDPKGLFDTVQKEHISMCGYGPVVSMMIGSGGTEGELLKYATSGDVTPAKEVVGYGAIAFR
ncbi:MAG: AmmeMemoRadiSam system protein B [Candidatus Thermoplasmatota archaeon]|nr:AmmeMemoRadiSam system protein B [Candidatus Thermoplasmatota archaeon]MBS3789639.1 AmmeMemoRadiSam system protein B [Candidatus Thermoplasmatota archaeon]